MTGDAKIAAAASRVGGQTNCMRTIISRYACCGIFPCVYGDSKSRAESAIIIFCHHWQAKAINMIGAHGQTVRHRPGEFDGTGYTLQLNSPALLAELTGITVD